MRFNSRELSCLAHQSSDRFDKEGILFAKERQEGIFRKSEVYVERLFRLRGNLLFYFKTRDPSSEVLGVFVLERCVVQLDDDEDDHSYYSFIIVFEGDERVIRLATQVEADRDGWIGALHVASYECMKIQLQSLREQLRNRTGKDPFSSQELAAVTSYPETTDGDRESAEDPFLEMCLMCTGLPVETSGRLPDTFASVHYMLPPPDERWVIHARTEIVEKSCHPMYVTMIGFRNPQSFSIATRIKVTVYSVKERMTNTMTQVGSLIFNLADILDAPANTISLKLCSFDYHDVGSVMVTAWQSECSFRLSSWSGESLVSPSDRQSNSNSVQVPIQNGLGVVSSQRRQSVTMLKQYFGNILCKTFRFPVNASPNHQLFVYEYMGEGRLTYVLPRQLLKLFVEEEKSEIEKLLNLGALCQPHGQSLRIDERVELLMLYEKLYSQAFLFLSELAGTTFKPSAKKAHKEVEFAPTNLHIQRMTVYNSEQDATRTYDIVTAGAFTAGAHKYRHGGLQRLIQQLEQRSFRVDRGRTRLAAIVNVLSDMDTLHMATNAACSQVCTAAVQGRADELKVAMAELEDKGRRLVKACESDLVTDGVTELSSARISAVPAQTTTPQTTAPAEGGGGGSGSRPGSRSTKTSLPETWRWSGTDFVKSPTEEPWDLTRLNAEAAVVCVLSKAEELAQQAPEQAVSWLDSLSPLVIKLKRCIEVMCSRAKSGLAFFSVKDSSPNLPLVHSLNYRRDVVFSQAVTTATTGFLTALLSADETTIRQMLEVGILLQFECLLSCHGDEMAMLEDMAVGVSDLSKVTFAFERAQAGASEEALVPTISGDRTEFVVTVPIPETMFNQLRLDSASKRFVRVVPVMFTIGINEQATIAERFGDVSLQETLNQENYHRLHGYFEKYTEFVKQSESKDVPSSPSSTTSSGSLNLENQMRHLHMSVLAKRNKNVDVLHQAAEICRALHGVRFTSCKSAKDRTAMAITLEQVQLLSRENDLAADVFFHALGSFRSEGVRRENTVKNSGVRKYAFNSIQLLSLPKLYRPPNGTYGNYET